MYLNCNSFSKELRKVIFIVLLLFTQLHSNAQESLYEVSANSNSQPWYCGSNDCESFEGNDHHKSIYWNMNSAPGIWVIGTTYLIGTDAFGAGCPDYAQFFVTDPGSIVNPEPYHLTHNAGNHPQFGGNAIIKLTRNSGKFGKFSVRTVFKDRYSKLSGGCGVDESAQGTVNYCLLAPSSGTTFGKTGFYDPNNIAGSQSLGNGTVRADADGKAFVHLFWQNDITNYCNEVFYDWSQGNPGGTRIKLVNGPGIYENCNGCYSSANFPTSAKLNNEQHKIYSPGWYMEVTGLGVYTFEIEVKDRYGNVYKGQQITVNVVPSCYGDPAPVLNITSNNTNSSDNGSIEVINGGYGNYLGGYKIDQNKIYQIDLAQFNNSNTIPSDFCTHYDVKVDDGTVAAHNIAIQNPDNICNAEIDFNGLDMDFSYAGTPGRYNLKIKQPIGSFRVYAKRKSHVGTYCYTYQPLEFFVGGKNQPAYSPCMIVLPRDIPSLFPDIKSDFAVKYALAHFTYEVVSGTGILVQTDLTNDEALLQEGAFLRLETRYEQPLVEKVDNNKNWTQSWGYDDEGRVIQESKQFFDNKGSPTQQQVKNLDAKVVLASQNIYDIYGRPALTTLPAPVRAREQTQFFQECGSDLQAGQDMYFVYKNNFITNNNSDYNFRNIDTYSPVSGSASSKLNNPDPVDNTVPGTLGWYYGPNNIKTATVDVSKGEDLFIEPTVASTSYPYSRTLYLEDGTNESIGATIPGDVFKMGSGHLNVSRVESLSSADITRITIYHQFRTANLFPGSPSVTNENYYKVISTDPNGQNCTTYYTKEDNMIIAVNEVTGDISYLFYDICNRLVCSVTPAGVRKLLNTPTPTPWADVDKTIYVYNHRGWLIQVTEPDGGTTKYKYRKDGSVRFSQNAEQAANGEYLFTHYDQAGRKIQSGLYNPGSNGISWNSISPSIMETTMLTVSDNGGLTGGSKSDVITTVYDIPDPSFPGPSTFLQKFTMGRAAYSYRDNGSKSWFSYDERGRMEWIAQLLPGLSGVKMITYKYAPNGNPSMISYQPQTTESFYHVYLYNGSSGLEKVYTSVNEPVFGTDGKPINMIEHAHYEYFLHGPLKRIELGEGLQGIDYTYTVDGSLKAINHFNKVNDPGQDPDDAFGLVLDYYSGDYTKAEVNLTSISASGYPNDYNGLVKATTWFTQKPASSTVPATPVTYAYKYNTRNELESATWGANTGNTFVPAGNSYKESGLTYDFNGNLRTLKRYGSDGTLPMHDFQYNYAANKNQLTSVTNNLTGTDYSNYQYNAIGQLSSTTKSGITTYVKHDARGMMTSLSGLNNGDNPVEKCDYDNCGLRYKKETYKSDHTLYYTTYYVRDASGNVVATYDDKVNVGTFVKTESPIYGADRIGAMEQNGSVQTYLYELRDHVGSVRAVVYSDFAGLPDGIFNDNFEQDNSSLYETPGGYTSMRSSEESFTGDYSLEVTATSVMPVKKMKVKAGAIVEISVRCLAGIPGQIAGPSDCIVQLVDQNGNSLKEGINEIAYTVILSHNVYDQWDLMSENFTVPSVLYNSNGTTADPDHVFIKLYFSQYAYMLTTHFDDLMIKVDQRYPENMDAKIASYTDYYPYGLELRREGDPYRYGYQGKYAEKDTESGWNAFQLRMYDPVIGRWLSTDPKREDASPYVGMGNNPITITDPDGGSKSPIFDSETGYFLGTDSKGFRGDILYMTTDKYNELSNHGTKVIKHRTALKYSSTTQGMPLDILKVSHQELFLMLTGGHSFVKVKMENTSAPTVGYMAEIRTYSDNSIEIGVPILDNSVVRTVENFYSVVVVHEFIGHHILNLSENDKTIKGIKEHIMIYEMQRIDPTWKKLKYGLREELEYSQEMYRGMLLDLKQQRKNRYIYGHY